MANVSAGGLYEWVRESVRRQCDTVIPCSKDLLFFLSFFLFLYVFVIL